MKENCPHKISKFGAWCPCSFDPESGCGRPENQLCVFVDEPISSKMATRIAAVCDEVKALLLEKNKAYGNSAAEPIRIFSKASAVEAINIRIDDKLNRIAKGQEYGQEDAELDLIGYLILKRCLTTPSPL